MTILMSFQCEEICIEGTYKQAFLVILAYQLIAATDGSS